MNDMKNLASKTKQELLSDLLLCITYEKDRENDLLCITEQYQLYPEKRKELEKTMLELLLETPMKIILFFACPTITTDKITSYPRAPSLFASQKFTLYNWMKYSQV